MIIIEPHVTRGEQENLWRAEAIASFNIVSMVWELADLDNLKWHLANCERDCKAVDPLWNGLKRVVMIGNWGSDYHRLVCSKLAPGHSVLLLPVPHTWAELHAQQDKIRAALQKFGEN